MAAFLAPGDGQGLDRCFGMDFSNGAHGDAGHLAALGDDVGSHFAAANEANTNGAADFLLPAREILMEIARRHAYRGRSRFVDQNVSLPIAFYLFSNDTFVFRQVNMFISSMRPNCAVIGSLD